MSAAVVPSYQEVLWPVLQAVKKLGGSGSIEELNEEVLNAGGFSEAQQAVVHGDGPGTELEYRMAWARTYLKGMGLLINSRRGVWSVTDAGRSAAREHLEPLRQQYLSRLAQRRRALGAAQGETVEDDVASAEPSWQEQVLDVMMQMAPSGFERLAQRLLREAGFTSATVTGRTGDGGLDGLGVYRMSLVSFPVFFQCKRYAGSVGAGAVRDFRGAMAGRGDKGLLITTGSFTAAARAEAGRDGAPPIDLIDGTRLCELLKQYDLGVATHVRMEEDVTIQPEFFSGL